MSKILIISIMLISSSCNSWVSDVYFQGVRDGAYSGCIYVYNHQESHFPEKHMKVCRAAYKEWDTFRKGKLNETN